MKVTRGGTDGHVVTRTDRGLPTSWQPCPWTHGTRRPKHCREGLSAAPLAFKCAIPSSYSEISFPCVWTHVRINRCTCVRVYPWVCILFVLRI